MANMVPEKLPNFNGLTTDQKIEELRKYCDYLQERLEWYSSVYRLADVREIAEAYEKGLLTK